MYRACLYIVAMLLFDAMLYSQEAKKEEKEEQRKGSHRITIGLGQTQLAEGKNSDGKKVWLAAPSWSLNYDFWISNKWAIGLQNDVVVEKYVVEDEDGQSLEREKPWALVPVALFKPGKHFSFIAGAGIEFEKEEDLGLTRLGVEYGAELKNGWEAGVAVMWDNKWGHYNSWVVEFSFSKIFFKKGTKAGD